VQAHDIPPQGISADLKEPGTDTIMIRVGSAAGGYLTSPWRIQNLSSFPSTQRGRIVAISRFSDLKRGNQIQTGLFKWNRLSVLRQMKLFLSSAIVEVGLGCA
jgi:hypothetical protein